MIQLSSKQWGGILGVLCFVTTLVVDPPGDLPRAAWLTAGCMFWMSFWWTLQVVPIAVTSLIPIVIFPLLDISSIKATTSAYANGTIYLLMGGFVIALAIEKWNLHQRLALQILIRTSGSAHYLVAGFMMTACFLSMWISNTATTVMLLPIGLAILQVVDEAMPQLPKKQKVAFQSALILSIAYSANIGGMGTLIGTPPNAYTAEFLRSNYDYPVSFLDWMTIGVPAILILLPLAWMLLTHVVFKFNFDTSVSMQKSLIARKRALGAMTYEEKLVTLAFACTALAWIARPALNSIELFSTLTDTGIAIITAICLFLIPSKNSGGRLLEWSDTEKMPWGILLLCGGALALAASVNSSGLSESIAEFISSLGLVEITAIMAVVVTVMVFLTEITSNTATVATFLPVIVLVSMSAGLDPVTVAIPVALAGSCCFMLPISTPPNAIVYSSGRVTIGQMAHAGFMLNMIAIVLITFMAVYLVPSVLMVVQ